MSQVSNETHLNYLHRVCSSLTVAGALIPSQSHQWPTTLAAVDMVSPHYTDHEAENKAQNCVKRIEAKGLSMTHHFSTSSTRIIAHRVMLVLLFGERLAKNNSSTAEDKPNRRIERIDFEWGTFAGSMFFPPLNFYAPQW